MSPEVCRFLDAGMTTLPHVVAAGVQKDLRKSRRNAERHRPSNEMLWCSAEAPPLLSLASPTPTGRFPDGSPRARWRQPWMLETGVAALPTVAELVRGVSVSCKNQDSGRCGWPCNGGAFQRAGLCKKKHGARAGPPRRILSFEIRGFCSSTAVVFTHLLAHETDSYLVCRLLLE